VTLDDDLAADHRSSLTPAAAVWHDSRMALARLLVVPLVVTAVVLGACGGSAAQLPTAPAAAVPPRAPQLLEARHRLGIFRLARGRAIELRLPHGSEVRAGGRSVRLTPIEFLVDPGYVAWELTAVAPGQTVLKGLADGKPVRLTLVVPG
jgi:hypothetical protein